MEARQPRPHPAHALHLRGHPPGDAPRAKIEEMITMVMHANRGRVYRRCACRDTAGKQLGTHCPQLATSSKHGRWAFAVDMPSLTGRRSTTRRSGYATRTDA